MITADRNAQPATRRPPTSEPRRYRPIESQLDKPGRDYLESTAFAIKLRTDAAFDRSALLRGIVLALRTSGVDIARHCDSEEEVAAYLLRFLPARTG